MEASGFDEANIDQYDFREPERMTLNDQKCAFSEAWLRAVAAASGFGVQGGTCPDDQSVDISVASRIRGIVSKPRLDVQLKCTADAPGDADEIIFRLPQNNYNDLRDAHAAVPKILVVLHVPPDPAEWLIAMESKVELYRSAWWISLRGLPANDNHEATRVGIPRSRRFTPDALRDIMTKLSGGEPL